MKNVNIAILGLGTVGGGVEQVLRENKDIIEQRILRDLGKDSSIHLKYIYDRVEPKLEELKPLFTQSFEEILEDGDVQVVIETMGGIEPATEFIKRALNAKKHVISANKAAIATAQGELERIAKQNNVKFMYEASVGGTIPVIQGIRNGLVANRILSIEGIVNGTTNYILTSMHEFGEDFEVILKKAQELGFAEADPSSDVDGFDAMYKLAILCNLAFGKYPKFEDIKVQSLREINKADIELAKKEGYALKYIASAKLLDDEKLDLSVGIKKVSKDNIFYNVNGVLNAISVECDRAGNVVFVGAGAGSQPTAAAILSDLVRIVEYV